MESNYIPDQDLEGVGISRLANLILNECSAMELECKKESISPPSMLAGTSTAFWSEEASNINASRAKALALLEKLTTLLQGPHEFLHEFVASNWDHGALYAFLQSGALEYMTSSGGSASLSSLSNISGIPQDKLLRILALLRCRNIVHEPEAGIFTLTATSEELVRDDDFRAWVEFQ